MQRYPISVNVLIFVGRVVRSVRALRVATRERQVEAASRVVCILYSGLPYLRILPKACVTVLLQKENVLLKFIAKSIF